MSNISSTTLVLYAGVSIFLVLPKRRTPWSLDMPESLLRSFTACISEKIAPMFGSPRDAAEHNG